MVHQEIHLQFHGVADDTADKDTQSACCKDYEQCLVEVEQTNPDLGHPHGSQNPNFFGLLEQVCTHGCAQRKETKEHHYGNNDAEHHVNYVLETIIRVIINWCNIDRSVHNSDWLSNCGFQVGLECLDSFGVIWVFDFNLQKVLIDVIHRSLSRESQKG